MFEYCLFVCSNFTHLAKQIYNTLYLRNVIPTSGSSIIEITEIYLG